MWMSLMDILFLIFIDTLPDVIKSQLGIYATDTNIYSCLIRKSVRFNKVKLADDIENDLLLTGGKWLINFNGSKIKLLSFQSSF